MVTGKDLSNIDPLYDKKVNCPYCDNHFTTKKVRSRFVKPLRVESDFAPVFAKEDQNNPLLYYVMVCPKCGLAFTEDYSKMISASASERVHTQITSKSGKVINYCDKREYQHAVNAYKLAIYSAQLLKEKHYIFGNLCLRLAWLFRGMEQNDEELRFLKLALDEFEKSYLHTDFKHETTPEMQILYLIGELHRRIGNHHDSIKYLGRVIDHPDKSRYMKYVNLAREQWRLGVEEYKEKRKQDNMDAS